MRSSASSFNFQYPPITLRSSSSCLHLVSYLTVTYLPPFTFPSIMCFRKQFLRQILPIQLAGQLTITPCCSVRTHLSSSAPLCYGTFIIVSTRINSLATKLAARCELSLICSCKDLSGLLWTRKCDYDFSEGSQFLEWLISCSVELSHSLPYVLVRLHNNTEPPHL